MSEYLLDQLRELTLPITRTTHALAVLTVRRERLIRAASAAGASRGQVAKAAGISRARVQQILDKKEEPR